VKAQQRPTPRGWQTVKEQIAHPDHEGVVGDLVRHVELGSYQLLVYDERLDNYVPHSVPHKWAVGIAT
jgi:hypothetical protein